MAIIRMGDYCCQGGNKLLDTDNFGIADLTISVRGKQTLRFAPLGNEPLSPRVALIGITPGGQSEKFAEYLRRMPIEEAAKRAAFEGAESVIKGLLRANGFASAIGLDLSGNLNDNPDIFTTSLVKCCLLVDGKYQYKAPDVISSPEARHCVVNRFLPDIQRFRSLEWAIFFGGPNWKAVHTLKIGGKTVREVLDGMGVEVVQFPHFAQNFQQRKLFSLNEEEEKDLIKRKPSYAVYAPNARRMRIALRDALVRRQTTNLWP